MSKNKAKAQAPAAIGQPDQVVAGEGTGETLPEAVEQPVEQAGEAVQQSAPAPEPEPEQDELIDAYVLCDGSINGVNRYQAGSVVQGIPESLAEANRHWLDVHTDAVEHALHSGAPVIDYEQGA